MSKSSKTRLGMTDSQNGAMLKLTAIKLSFPVCSCVPPTGLCWDLQQAEVTSQTTWASAHSSFLVP